MNKIIISDTSCLIALQNIGLLSLLKDLYQEILITKEVKNEFESELPDWIIVIEVKNKDKQDEIEQRLDKGEASSIALALEINNSVLIIDEIKGRKIAQSLNIEIIGTIGVLLLANKRELITDIPDIILRLSNKGFRLSDKLVEQLIARYSKK